MSAIVYPSALPVPQASSIQSRERRALAPEGGPYDVRALQRDRYAQEQITLPPMNAEKAAIFQAWWQDDLVMGGAWFASTWPLPQGMIAGVRRMLAPPHWDFIPTPTGNHWRVSFPCEVRGRGELPQQSVDTDPYFANVVLLMHLDGANGSTSIVDSSSYAHTCSVSGSAALSTAAPKFGSACYQGAANGVITATLGGEGTMTGDFTVEMWLLQIQNNVVFMGDDVYLYNDYFQSNGNLFTPVPVVTTLSFVPFAHVAISRNSGVIRTFRNGVLAGTQAYAPTIDLGTMYFGKFAPNNNLYFLETLDEVRVTQGVGRYTSDFAVPTAPFPDS